MSSAMCIDVPNDPEFNLKSRKRPRSRDEDCCELMPISKRINDLHIRSGIPEPSTSLNNPSVSEHPDLRNHRDMMQDNVNMYMTELHRQNMGIKDPRIPSGYCPELGVSDNPYYYHVNGILYEANVQRLQRLSKPVT